MEDLHSDLSKKFSISEQIAIMLYKSSNKTVHYETYVLSQILGEFDYKYEYHQKTFEFLVSCLHYLDEFSKFQKLLKEIEF